ncbi:MAG: transposase [Acidobacteriota bacterium]|nr:transposase [Acidobacteriota bacterium]
MARPPRLATSRYKGRQCCFLTFCTYERQRLLVERETVDALREQLLRSSQANDVAVDAYVFMPDHVHLLATGLTEDADLTAFVSHFKRQAGWRFRRDVGRRLWQEGFHDRVLRDDSDRWPTVAYIVANPVRAGFVTAAEEYEFWGSLIHSRDEILKTLAMHGAYTAPGLHL